MSNDKEKKQQLKELKPRKYRIYGIFNFKKRQLIYVDLDIDKVEFEFDLEGYDDEEYGVVSFFVLLN